MTSTIGPSQTALYSTQITTCTLFTHDTAEYNIQSTDQQHYSVDNEGTHMSQNIESHLRS